MQAGTCRVSQRRARASRRNCSTASATAARSARGMLASVSNIDPAMLERARAGDPAAVEQVLGAITRDAKQARYRPPRWMWIVAGVVSGVCVIALALAYFGTDATTSSSLQRPQLTADGFAKGLAIGLVAGIAIGWAAGRYRHSSRSNP